MTGRGHHVDHARGDVGVLGDHLSEQSCPVRGVRGGLEDDGVPRCQRRHDLGEVDLDRIVPRSDRADDTDGFPAHRPVGSHAERFGEPQAGLPVVRLGQVGDPGQPRQRRIELWTVGQRDRTPDFGHRRRPQLVGVLGQRLVQLPDAAHPEGEVIGPVGVVERMPRRGDRGVHVGRRSVGGHADDLFRRGIDVVIRRAVGGRDESPVDQHPFFAPDLCHHAPECSVRPAGELRRQMRRTVVQELFS